MTALVAAGMNSSPVKRWLSGTSAVRAGMSAKSPRHDGFDGDHCGNLHAFDGDWRCVSETWPNPRRHSSMVCEPILAVEPG